ncbi:MAG: hypothetical protein RMI04_09210 [Thermofilaceae archaeon]|nr:hypothetical protein [Thermofilaceae archaeon]
MEAVLVVVEKLREIFSILTNIRKKEEEIDELFERKVKIWENSGSFPYRDLELGKVKVSSPLSFLKGEETEEEEKLSVYIRTNEAYLHLRRKGEYKNLISRGGEVDVETLMILAALEAKNPGLLDKVITTLKRDDEVTAAALERLKNAVALVELALK